MMKKIGSLLAHGLVTGGMVYALIALSAVPAAACTPAECADLQQIASQLCKAVLHCDGGGHVTLCNSGGVAIVCQDLRGGYCGSFFAQCGN